MAGRTIEAKGVDPQTERVVVDCDDHCGETLKDFSHAQASFVPHDSASIYTCGLTNGYECEHWTNKARDLDGTIHLEVISIHSSEQTG